MTDRELMQQALDALTTYDGTNGESKRKRVLTDLRDRLAQPEQKPLTEKRIEELYSFWVVDCQDVVGFARAIERNKAKLIAEQAARSCKVGGPCVPTQTGPCACKELPPPINPVVEQPQMQPCAGRNCGSTNPNLHSAECFEDYEMATGMNQRKPLTPDQIFAIADQHPVEGFDPEIMAFVRAIEAAHGITEVAK